jgi:DNA-binding NtrC family response regulator
LILGDEVLGLLVGYRWPGNIRELKNVMERAVALCDGPEITSDHLPLERMGNGADLFDLNEAAKVEASVPTDVTARLPPLDDPAKSADRQRILDALVASNWNQTRAAERLKMPRRTFVSKLDQYGIPRPQKSIGGNTRGADARDADDQLAD